MLRDTTMRENMIRSLLTKIICTRLVLYELVRQNRDLLVRDTLSTVSFSPIVHDKNRWLTLSYLQYYLMLVFGNL